jgi:2-desacetyl-2-hydroxyethyl bacteriochlorophyllide A dehydrogenase
VNPVTRQSLWFEGSSRVSLRDEQLAGPGPGEVLVHTTLCAISAGTEMLFYRGTLEPGAEIDSLLADYRRPITWPLRYGYASVGIVVAAGDGVPPATVGRTVFGFVPHATAFTARLDDLVEVPAGIAPEDAAFFASAETAATLTLDTAPLLGERITVFGLGVVGLLTTGLLSRFPLSRLTGVDPHALRRHAAEERGALTRDPRAAEGPRGTEDACLELSGSPDGFRAAVAACGFAGRLVVGSWYAAAGRGALGAFDTAFHRKRLRMLASQVSTIDPALSGRWDRERRRAAAWEAIRALQPSRLVTHRVPFGSAEEAYRIVSETPEEALQVLLTIDQA